MAQFTFLVCSERSGSNFITSLMNGHPHISGPPPSHLFRLFGTNMDRYGPLEDDSEWKCLIQDIVAGFDAMLGHWNISVTTEEVLAGCTRRTSAELLRFIYEKEAEHDGACHMLIKENHTYQFAPFLMAHFPKCRFLFFVRDPRDVAASWTKTDTIPGGVEKAVATWLKDQSAALGLFHQLRGSGRALVLRYEDVLRDTEAALSEVVAWMGLEYTPDMLEYHTKSRTQKNASRIDAWANLSRGVMHDNYSKFSQALGEDDVRFIELRCWNLMNVLGYEQQLVKQLPSESERSGEIECLRSRLNPGRHKVQQGECEIRQQRLEVINSILQRQPKCALRVR